MITKSFQPLRKRVFPSFPSQMPDIPLIQDKKILMKSLKITF